MRRIFIFIIACVPYLLLSSFLLLKDPPVWLDESIFVNTVLRQINHQTNTFDIYYHSLGQQPSILFGYPPLYFYSLAQWINLFGASIESVRLLSVILGLVSLLFFYLILRRLFPLKPAAFWGTLLLGMEMNFTRASRIARMDILVVLIILSSFFFLLISKKNIYLQIFAGILAGLATLTHSIGFLAPLILSVYIFWDHTPLKSKLRSLVIISIPVLTANLLWYIFFIRNNLDSFTAAFSVQYLRKLDGIPFAIDLLKTSFPWRITITSYLILYLTLLVTAYRFKNKLDLFLASAIPIIALITLFGKEGWYFVYIQPFFIITALSLIFRQKKSKNFSISFLAAVFFILINIMLLLFFRKQFYYTPVYIPLPEAIGYSYDYHDFSEKVKQALPEEGNILISSLPDPYFDLQSNTKLKIYQLPGIPVPKQVFDDLLEKADYIVISVVTYWPIGQYIKDNEESFVAIDQPKGYYTLVVKLKPRGERIVR